MEENQTMDEENAEEDEVAQVENNEEDENDENEILSIESEKSQTNVNETTSGENEDVTDISIQQNTKIEEFSLDVASEHENVVNIDLSAMSEKEEETENKSVEEIENKNYIDEKQETDESGESVLEKQESENVKEDTQEDDVGVDLDMLTALKRIRKSQQSDTQSFALFASDHELKRLSMLSTIPEELDEVEEKIPRKDKQKKVRKGKSKDYPRLDFHKQEVDVEENQEMSDSCRQEYYMLSERLETEYAEEKAKNAYLTKQLYQHFQKRKMFHVLQEEKAPLDSIKEYERLLDHFKSFTDATTYEQALIKNEIAELKERYLTKQAEAVTALEHMVRVEYETGREVVSEGNKEVEEKLIDRLIKRQKLQLDTLTRIRIDYIKMRNRVTELQVVLSALDNLGPNFRLIDYEQLKIDNQNLRDKLEEKESEITRIRSRCENTMQILAHQREKTSAFDNEIISLRTAFENSAKECAEVREQLNEVKRERYLFHTGIERLKRQCGLLDKPKFLKDMSATFKEAESIAQRVEEVKAECGGVVLKLEKLRKNMTPYKLKIIKYKMSEDYYNRKQSLDTGISDLTTLMFLTRETESHRNSNDTSLF